MRPRAHFIAKSLIAFPMGLLVVSPMFDILLFSTHARIWARIGFGVLTVGLLGGLLSLGAEVWELRHEHRATRPFRISLWETGVFLSALLFYLTSWVIRVSVHIDNIGGGEFACSALGSVILLGGGWLGGVIVDRLHIGLSEDPTAEAAARRAQRRQEPNR